jgi:hypothetical protein
VATLATLAELAPSLVRKALPGEKNSSAPRLLAALLAGGRVAAFAGDRAAMLVAQSEAVAAAAAMVAMGQAGESSGGGGGADDDGWQEAAQRKLEEAAGGGEGEIGAPEDLLPDADGGRQCISDEDLLAMRLRALVGWAGGEGYAAAMAGAAPLRRVLGAGAGGGG